MESIEIFGAIITPMFIMIIWQVRSVCKKMDSIWKRVNHHSHAGFKDHEIEGKVVIIDGE